MRKNIILSLLAFLSVGTSYSQDSIRWKPVNEAEFIELLGKVHDKKATSFEKDGYRDKVLMQQVVRSTFEEYMKAKQFKKDWEFIENIRKDEIKALQKENEELRADNERLKTNQGLDKLVAKLQADSSDLVNQIQTCKDELVDMQQQISEIRKNNEALQAANDVANEEIKSFQVWKQKLVDDFNSGYIAVEQMPLESIDSVAINTLIKSTDMLDSFSGNDIDKIKAQCRNLKNLKNLSVTYIAAEKVLQTSANKLSVDTALKNLRNSGSACTPERKKETDALIKILSAYGTHIDKFSGILNHVENISTRPENKDLPKRDRDAHIEELKEAINLELNTESGYPKSYIYLNSLLKQLRDSLNQFPKVDYIRSIRDKMNK